MTYSAQVIHAMATHILGCRWCCGGDEGIKAGTLDEGLHPDELVEYIQGTHLDPALWVLEL